MDGIVLLDTLYLNVRYPNSDVFDFWEPYSQDVDRVKLKKGIARRGFVLRTGGSGYPISVWKHDIRAFLTNQVDEKRGEGKGMGIWVQVGPKFLISSGLYLKHRVKDFLEAIGVQGDWPINITRLDLAVDLFGDDMATQDTELWREGWVGRSKVSAMFFNSKTGDLETINIGKRGSSIYLRIYDKVAQALTDGDLPFWLDIWDEHYQGKVIRVEWEVKPVQGRFPEDLQNLEFFVGFSIRELANYLLGWGRLCVPDQADKNRRRWKPAPFWSNLEYVLEKWSDGVYWPTTRYGPEHNGVSEEYIKFLSGTISGAMARFSPDDPNLMKVIEGLERYGESLEIIQSKAEEKAAVIRIL